jgi:hypothetical protein
LKAANTDPDDETVPPEGFVALGVGELFGSALVTVFCGGVTTVRVRVDGELSIVVEEFEFCA